MTFGTVTENRVRTKVGAAEINLMRSVMKRVLDYWRAVSQTAQSTYRDQSDGKMKANQ